MPKYRVEVKPHTTVEELSGAKEGRSWRIRSQKHVWLHIEGADYPVELSVNLRNGRNGAPDQSAYAPGFYSIDWEASAFIGERGKLMLGGELVLVAETAAQAVKVPNARAAE